MTALAAAVVSYLLGGIPFAQIAARLKGIDLRLHGSGNVGATNAIRVLGKKFGIPVLLADMLKGWAAAALVPRAFGSTSAEMGILCGVAAVLGHIWPITLRFRGGKGVATSGGALLALAPLATVVGLITFVGVLLAFRYVSLASLCASVALVSMLWIRPSPASLRLAATALAVVVVFRHRANVSRLLAGTEARILSRSPRGKTS
jgi:acyl phosphate:glycerol-3-phosphate acyltransferase